MRISYWSSDVCSSDLAPHHPVVDVEPPFPHLDPVARKTDDLLDVVDRGVPGQLEDEDVAPLRRLTEDAALEQRRPEGQALMAVAKIGRASCRDSVCQEV